MKKFLMIVLAVAGVAIAGCSSSKNGNGAMDSSAVDSTKVADTTKTVTDTTKTVPDTTKQQ